MTLADGLYAVVHDQRPRFVAAFIVRDGRVRREDCAPILRNRLGYWMGQARRVEYGRP